MRRPRASLNVGTRLLVIVLSALVIALSVATFGFNALLARTVSGNGDALLRQRADSERAAIQIVDGQIRVAETTDDTGADSRLWIFQGDRAIEAPAAGARTATAARALARGGGGYVDVPATDERLFALPVAARDGRRLGTVVAGISVAPYEQTRRAALVGSLLLAGALLSIVGVAVWWLLRSAMRPVAQMTEQAAAWSEHQLDRRFDLGPPHDELTRLGATLDGLLDRLAASLRHERRFSAELSHELRTPLSIVIAEAELALRRDRAAPEYREALGTILRNAEQVARIVEALVAAAQHEASATRGIADAHVVACDVIDALEGLALGRRVKLSADSPQPPLWIGLDADLAERILQPVVENACRYGRTRVDISLERRGSHVAYLISDDGPGVDDDEREAIFDAGVRGRVGVSTGGPGAGLGLALARRLARSAAGDVDLRDAPEGGAFLVSLPSA